MTPSNKKLVSKNRTVFLISALYSVFKVQKSVSAHTKCNRFIHKRSHDECDKTSFVYLHKGNSNFPQIDRHHKRETNNSQDTFRSEIAREDKGSPAKFTKLP